VDLSEQHEISAHLDRIRHLIDVPNFVVKLMFLETDNLFIEKKET